MANYYHHSPDKTHNRVCFVLTWKCLGVMWRKQRPLAVPPCLLLTLSVVPCPWSSVSFNSVPGVLLQEHNPLDVGVSWTCWVGWAWSEVSSSLLSQELCSSVSVTGAQRLGCDGLPGTLQELPPRDCSPLHHTRVVGAKVWSVLMFSRQALYPVSCPISLFSQRPLLHEHIWEISF